jgi:hypothetical protein
MQTNNLIIVNSSLTVVITLQNWPQDTFGPFADALIKKGFDVNLPTTVQAMQVQSAAPFARKGSTTGLGIEYPARRIPIQITNNVTNPQDNINEVFAVLRGIGYAPEESIERIDIQGYVTIKIQGGDRAYSFVQNLIDKNIVEKIGRIMDHKTKAVGVRLSSEEPLLRGISASPFLLLLEPLFTDPSDSKLSVQLNYATDNGEKAIQFLEGLYDRLKKIIIELKG